MDVTQREEQVLTADDTVASLGLVFVALPPLPPPPMIVKTVHRGTWADNQGIGPGCEVLELGGLKVGSMTREEFTKAIKSRPLRIRLQPPNCTAWKQVAHFQKETVRLQFKKVLLQKALRDEHDKVKEELGVDLRAEEERKAKNHESRRELARQRSGLEDQKQQLETHETELRSREEQIQSFEKETQNRRKKLEVEKLHLEKQQAELERARHDFNEMRKNSLEAIEKEKQVLELERKRLAAQQDNTCIAEGEREDLELERKRLEGSKKELASERSEFDAAVERLRLEAVQLELREAKMAQERESMEEDVSGMGRQREELQAQKAKVASLEEEIERQRVELAESRAKAQEHLELLASSQAQVAKEKSDFSEKVKKVQQQLLSQKRQLIQAKKAGEKVESSSQTERPVVEVGLQAFAEAFEAATQTEDSSENTDVDTADEVQVKQLLQMTQQLQGMLDFRSGSSRETLTETLQRMLEVLDGKKMPRKERSQPLRVLSPDGPQSEQSAKKAMAHTMVVRKLLAHELKKESRAPGEGRRARPKSLPRR